MSKDKVEAVRARAEQDLEFFIRLVAPHRLLGGVHGSLISWWNREDAKSHQLVLLPRGHQKSALVAYRAAWEITRKPETTILYISSTANLAEKQLKAIKDILTCDIYRRYWPEMVNTDEGKRERWTSSEISVDHPIRKKEGIRDPTVFTAGLTSTITGMHCSVSIMDDVVVYENAYTEEGRAKVLEAYSLLSSIENTDAVEWVVGTRYHPKDLYQDLVDMAEDLFTEEGELFDTRSVFEVFERQVENRGDGTGEFLWPRQRRVDGKWFGFSMEVLSKKKAQYLDKSQFRAQYYNDPNSDDTAPIPRESFQYYDKGFLSQTAGVWYFRDKRLNVIAAIDFAYSLNKQADFTVIVVIGMDHQGCIYILDIYRFKTDRIQEYYSKILEAHIKWGFRKIRAEVTAAQMAIVKNLKESVQANGSYFVIEDFNPRGQGSKEERVATILEPKYQNSAVYHYKGGNCQILEEELVMRRPPHDDVKDCLASAVEIIYPPKRDRMQQRLPTVSYHPRFGGVM